MNASRWLCIVGILGSLFWIALQTAFQPGWGSPGSAAYARYETWNRVWPIGLLLMGLGFAGLYLSVRGLANRLVRIGAWLTFIGMLLMLIGNVLIGVGAWRAHVLPVWLCILLIAHLPLAFIAMINQMLVGPRPSSPQSCAGGCSLCSPLSSSAWCSSSLRCSAPTSRSFLHVRARQVTP